MPREEREKRMQTYQEFLKDIELVRAGSSERVSELDLGNPRDLHAWLTGLLCSGDAAQAVTVPFSARAISPAKYPHAGGKKLRAMAGQCRPRTIHRSFSIPGKWW